MKAILLDRDDTINVDPGYLRDPGQVELLPCVGEGLRLLRDARYRFFVMTNQSGVARGLISESELHAVNSRIAELIAAEGVKIERFYVCPHRDEDDCRCRKPRPGLFEQFFRDTGANPLLCFSIGDKTRDLEAAASFGVPGVLLWKQKGGPPPEVPENLVYCANDLVDAAQFILKQQGN